ncbi:MAG TPA: ATP-binding protein [Anaerolineae bacterium]|nr:ATP-binding protein [Anaerolineae bacterium]HQH37873.1 ATP-binding protein [Anaerolineae bacterium]
MRDTIQPHSGQLTALLPTADATLLAETLIAFANADGGALYIGVDENGAPTGDFYPEEFGEVVQQAERLCRPPIPVTWEQIESGGAFVFVGRVQRSAELHTLHDGRVLVRTGAENRLLTGEQLQQIVASRSTGEYEAEPVPGATRDDFDADILREFVEMWEKRQGRPLSRPLDDMLVEMGWLLPGGQPTVAGILLFGKNPQAFIPRSGLTFVRFDGTQVHKESGEAGYGRRVEFNGPLAHIIQRAWDILQAEIRVGAVVHGLERREQWQYPPTAIREALVNAVAHRDYRLRGRAIEVRMFADRLEISSPGGLPGYITVDNIVDEHFSRNPRLVNGLFQWGYIEELGLGVDLMIQDMVNAGHPPPQFRAQEYAFTVIFESSRQRAPLLPVSADLTMNERQAKALAYLQQNDRITNRDYQALCPDVTAETLRLDLADMVERGVLLKIGEKRGTYYILK